MEKCEYRVVWKRQGLKQKAKRYATLKGANRFMDLLGPEPWKAFGKEAEEQYCCGGYQCACGGMTWKQHLEFHKKSGQPEIESIRLEKRNVGEWEKTNRTN